MRLAGLETATAVAEPSGEAAALEIPRSRIFAPDFVRVMFADFRFRPIEGGKGMRPFAAHFQLRRDPLAK